jgi:hypothetical protein
MVLYSMIDTAVTSLPSASFRSRCAATTSPHSATRRVDPLPMRLFLLLLSAALAQLAGGCTTLIAGRDATLDGSLLAAHTNYGVGDVDARLGARARARPPGRRAATNILVA